MVAGKLLDARLALVLFLGPLACDGFRDFEPLRAGEADADGADVEDDGADIEDDGDDEADTDSDVNADGDVDSDSDADADDDADGDDGDLTDTDPSCSDPEAPEDVIAVAVIEANGTIAIDLAWTAADDDNVSFVVQRRDGDCSASGSWTAVASTDDMLVTDSMGLTRDALYCYRVRAALEECESAWSEKVSAYTAPIDALDLNVTAKQGALQLSWSDPNSLTTKYVIERRPASGGAYAVIDAVLTPKASYQDTDVDLEPYTSYDYRVTAQHPGGEYTAAAQAKTFPNDVTDLDRDTSTSCGSSFKRDLRLAWSDPNSGIADCCDFLLEYVRCDASESETECLAKGTTKVRLPARQETLQLVDLEPGERYRVWLRVQSDVGTTAGMTFVDTASSVGCGDSQNTVRPTYGLTYGSVYFDELPTLYKKRMQRNPNSCSGDPNSTVWSTCLDANVTSYTDTNVTTDTTYCYLLRYDDDCDGVADSTHPAGWSGSSGCSVRSVLPPPSSVEANRTANSVTLSWDWDNNTSFPHYHIDRYEPGNAIPMRFELVRSCNDVSEQPFTEYSDTTIAADTNYTYRIGVYHSEGVTVMAEINVTAP